MAKYKSFQDGDDFDELADRLRRDVAALVIRLQDNPVYSSLPAEHQIEVVMAGVETALVGCCFAMIEKRGQPAMLEHIRNYLPQAADHANMISGR